MNGVTLKVPSSVNHCADVAAPAVEAEPSAGIVTVHLRKSTGTSRPAGGPSSNTTVTVAGDGSGFCAVAVKRNETPWCSDVDPTGVRATVTPEVAAEDARGTRPATTATSATRARAGIGSGPLGSAPLPG